MPTRPEESQIAFAIRWLLDSETEACIEATITAEVRVLEAGGPASPIGHAVVKALRARIADRAQG